MVHLEFFEKPGCAGNARQRALLEAAGVVLERHNLLAHPWSPETLRPFFGGLPVSEWFNPAAPRIKSGDVRPGDLTEEKALALLVREPILIRRPLMRRADGVCRAGFDQDRLIGFVDLGADPQRVAQAGACQRRSASAQVA